VLTFDSLSVRVHCCCRYLFNAIDNFPGAQHPEALLYKLLQRRWLSSAYGPALLHLSQAWRNSKCLGFDITHTTAALLQATPPGLLQEDPTELLPAIQCACQPIACPADQVAPLLEAASLLLKASPTWQPFHLAATIGTTAAAKPPSNCTSEAREAFYLTQIQLLKLLLDHCCSDPATSMPNDTVFLYPSIKTALLAGAESAVVQLLLAHAPYWTADDLRDTDAQGGLGGYS
jgi:hypothetical protein